MFQYFEKEYNTLKIKPIYLLKIQFNEQISDILKINAIFVKNIRRIENKWTNLIFLQYIGVLRDIRTTHCSWGFLFVTKCFMAGICAKGWT